MLVRPCIAPDPDSSLVPEIKKKRESGGIRCINICIDAFMTPEQPR